MKNEKLNIDLNAVFGKIVEENMGDMNIEEKIKIEVAKYLADIPTRKIDVVTKDQVNTVTGAHHVFEKVLRSVSTKTPVYLAGEAGVGKSHLVTQVAQALGLDLYMVSVGEQTTKTDFFGFMNANGVYVEGTLYKPAKNGGMLLIDEMDSGNSNVFTMLNSAISNGIIQFPNGEFVTTHPDFRIIGTANTFGKGANIKYAGRNPLDFATLNRFTPIYVGIDEAIEKQLVNNDAWLKVVRKARKIAEDDLDNVYIGQRNATYGAAHLEAGWTFEETYEAFITWGLSEDDIRTLEPAKKLWKAPKKVQPKQGEKVESDDDVEVVEIDPKDEDWDEPKETEEVLDVNNW